MRHILLLGSAALLLAGCGSDPNSFEGSDEALQDAGSSRVEYRWTTGSGPSFSGTGAIDYADKTGELVMTSKGMELPGGEMQVRFIGRTTYVGFTLLGHLRWQKETESAPTGADRFVPGPGGPNPDGLLSMLKDASTRVERLGEEEVRGVSTEHYRANLDKSRLGEDAPEQPDEVVVEAWIDDEGLVRRLRVPLGDVETLTVELFDFGAKVEVEAPPADEIVSEDELVKLMEKDCAGKKVDENDFCAAFVGLGSGDESSPTETTPRRVSDY